jgi:hypothetical protein
MIERDLVGQQDREFLTARIAALFTELGGNVSMRSLGQEAKARQYFSADMLAALEDRAVGEFCRAAVKHTKTPDGLPFAKPLAGDEDARWKQLDLMTYAEVVDVIRRDADAIEADHKELRRLHQWCRLKFGKAPKIPRLG